MKIIIEQVVYFCLKESRRAAVDYDMTFDGVTAVEMYIVAH